MNQNVFVAVSGLIFAFQHSYYIFLSNGGNSAVVFVSAVAFYFIHVRIPGVSMFRDKVCIFIRTVKRHRCAVFCHSGRNAGFCFAKHVIDLICCRFQAGSLYVIAGLDNDACLGRIELSVIVLIVYIVDVRFRFVAVSILNGISFNDLQSNRLGIIYCALEADTAESIAVKIHGVPVPGEKLKLIFTVLQDVVIRLNGVLNLLIPADFQIVALLQNTYICNLRSSSVCVGSLCICDTGQNRGDCKRTCCNQRKMFSFSAHFFAPPYWASYYEIPLHDSPAEDISYIYILIKIEIS